MPNGESRSPARTNSPFGKNAIAFCSRHRAALCFSLSSELGSAEREITPTIPAEIGNPPTNVPRSILRPPRHPPIVQKGTIRFGAGKEEEDPSGGKDLGRTLRKRS